MEHKLYAQGGINSSGFSLGNLNVTCSSREGLADFARQCILKGYNAVQTRSSTTSKTCETCDCNQGLKVKYNVFKADTGEKIGGCFVLRPQKDLAARKALKAYAAYTENEVLRADIRNWLNLIDIDTEAVEPGRKIKTTGLAFSSNGDDEELYAVQEAKIQETERMAAIGRALTEVLESGYHLTLTNAKNEVVDSIYSVGGVLACVAKDTKESEGL